MFRALVPVDLARLSVDALVVGLALRSLPCFESGVGVGADVTGRDWFCGPSASGRYPSRFGLRCSMAATHASQQQGDSSAPR